MRIDSEVRSTIFRGRPRQVSSGNLPTLDAADFSQVCMRNSPKVDCSQPQPCGMSAEQRFRGGLVSRAHRLLNHSTLGLRVVKKNMVPRNTPPWVQGSGNPEPCTLDPKPLTRNSKPETRRGHGELECHVCLQLFTQPVKPSAGT